MNKRFKLLLPVGAVVALVAILIFVTHGKNIALLSPAGTIASKQRDLIVGATLLSLVIIIPVLVLTFVIAWRYRASNQRATYQPEWDHSRVLETIWWGIPCAIIAVLAVVTWTSSHQLDPFRPIASDKKPLTIQVVAMEWKWLFIYPEQHIATVNYLQIPKDTPVNFEITADAPMNSFWIPKLGGQVYAMAGMETRLHLMATQTGTFEGSSANLSGKGFAGMRFNVDATSRSDFDTWIASVQGSPLLLDSDSYAQLAAPSESNPPAYYATTNIGLYDTVMMKFMAPQGSLTKSEDHEAMTMSEHMQMMQQ